MTNYDFFCETCKVETTVQEENMPRALMTLRSSGWCMIKIDCAIYRFCCKSCKDKFLKKRNDMMLDILRSDIDF